MKEIQELNRGVLRGNEVAGFTLGPLSDLMPKNITLCPFNYHVFMNLAQDLAEKVYGLKFDGPKKDKVGQGKGFYLVCAY